MVVRRDNSEAVQLLATALNRGGLGIAPCDTIYGILGAVPASEAKIRDLKGRDERKPFLVLEASAEAVIQASETKIPEMLLSLWPGPLTLVVKTRNRTTGYRIPDDSFLTAVIQQTGSLYSTSVNIAGTPDLWEIDEIINRFKHKVDIIVNGGDLEGRLSSTVIDISVVPYVILREGAGVLPEEIRRKCR
ncbi:MAG: L-threonylcarbamoyladenylate synthase [Spirochaetales bacterium]|jgi:L-threonylcarbamoyladenylate synthase|nr:L-threonylcarbamoyladenylate synthase [Spirochaetales bacterium]